MSEPDKTNAIRRAITRFQFEPAYTMDNAVADILAVIPSDHEMERHHAKIMRSAIADALSYLVNAKGDCAQTALGMLTAPEVRAALAQSPSRGQGVADAPQG